MSTFFYWIVYLFPTDISKFFYIFRILVFCWLNLLEISFSTLACLFIIFSVSFDFHIPLGLSSGRHKQELAIQTEKDLLFLLSCTFPVLVLSFWQKLYLPVTTTLTGKLLPSLTLLGPWQHYFLLCTYRSIDSNRCQLLLISGFFTIFCSFPFLPWILILSDLFIHLFIYLFISSKGIMIIDATVL